MYKYFVVELYIFCSDSCVLSANSTSRGNEFSKLYCLSTQSNNIVFTESIALNTSCERTEFKSPLLMPNDAILESIVVNKSDARFLIKSMDVLTEKYNLYIDRL